MNIPHGTIVAVADGEKLRLFRNKAVEPQISLVPLAGPELDSDNAGSGSRHHSSSANPDSGRIAEDSFAASTVEYLNREVLEARIEHLVIIADPRTLGEMRKNFHQKLEAKLVGQIAKDLTSHSVEAIENALANAPSARS